MTITKPEFDGKTFYCYRKGNYVAINNALSSISWDRLFNDCNYDVQTVYDNFLSIIHSLMNRYIPKQSPSVRVKHNSKLRILARKKAKYLLSAFKSRQISEILLQKSFSGV